MLPKRPYKLHLRIKYTTGEEFWYPYSRYKTYEHTIQAFADIYEHPRKYEGWRILPVAKIRNEEDSWVSYYETEEK